MTPAPPPEAINWLAVTKDVVTIAATLFGGWIAFTGLSTWKRQLHGQSKLELSRKLGLAIRLFREELIYFRNPVDYGGDIAAALEHYKIDPAPLHQKKSVQEQLAVKRWKFEKLAKRWNEVASISLEAELVIGQHLAAPLNDCRDILNAIDTAILKYEMTLQFPESTAEFYKTSMEIIYGLPGDDFGKSADLSLNKVLDIVKSELRPAKSELWEKLRRRIKK